jgi:osmotically inducible lipoprotein OsmB
MKRAIAMLSVLMVVSTFAFGCTNMSPTAQGAASGGILGAGGGAALTAIAGGNPAIGAAVGGGVGMVAGGLIGASKEK